MEIIGTNSAMSIAGMPGRVPQALPRSSMSPLADTARLPGQNAGEASSAAGRTREAARPGSADQAEKLEQEVRESVEKLNNFIRPYVTSLEFSIDKDLGRIVVKIIDNETEEVIKQIPSEDVLELTKALDKVAGLIVEQEA